MCLWKSGNFFMWYPGYVTQFTCVLSCYQSFLLLDDYVSPEIWFCWNSPMANTIHLNMLKIRNSLLIFIAAVNSLERWPNKKQRLGSILIVEKQTCHLQATLPWPGNHRKFNHCHQIKLNYKNCTAPFLFSNTRDVALARIKNRTA